MSYLVLARKWRPRKFEELVGQEHVVRALSNGLDSGRIHHAFLFTGTRGVGKTTVARLLAKALNCDKGVSAHPCGECGTCKEIEEGRFVDLLEVDAASRTKVEDTRELLENVQYAPSRGRYKVYLIDEVHMLSGHSFNALLKTLEEPPPHVKFLLATTDPQKLPVTVVSRCLQFHLKRLMPALIVGRLTEILKTEDIAFEGAALELLAQGADGSLRDALSLLDQALVYGAGQVLEADVRKMLGTIDRAHVLALLNALANADAAQLLSVCQTMDEQAPDYHQVLGECSEALLRLTREQWVAGTGFEEVGDKAPWLALAHSVPAEELQLWYQILLLGRRDLSLALNPRSGFEMTMLRCLAFKPAPDPQPHSQGAGASHATRPGASSTTRGAARSMGQPKAQASAAAHASVDNQAKTSITVEHASNDAKLPNVIPLSRSNQALQVNPKRRADVDSTPVTMPAEWHSPEAFPQWVQGLRLTGALQSLMSQCALVEATPERLTLKCDSKAASFLTDDRLKQLETLIRSVSGLAIKLHIDSASPTKTVQALAGAAALPTLASKQNAQAQLVKSKAEQAFLLDPAVIALRERFKAEVKLDSIQPIDSRGQHER